MGLEFQLSVPVLTVFVQGLLSFFSPCVVPLVPVYLGYLSGGAARREADGTLRYPRGRVLCNTFFFVLGISFAFFLLGLGMTALGGFLGRHQRVLAVAGGVVAILFGLYQLGLFGQSRLLATERRLPLRLEKLAMSPLTALVMGFVFSFAWTPCVGPALASVLLLAASAGTRGTGLLLIGVYTLGFVLPFLAVGLFSTGLLSLLKKHRRLLPWAVRLGGVLMILMGVMMVTGLMTRLSGDLARLGAEPPAAAETAAETAPQAPVETDAPAGSTQATEQAEQALPPAPALELTDQYGVTHKLSEYRGKVVFLNFWATWCPPCRQEMPDIQTIYETYAAQEDPEVIILGLATPGVGGEEDLEGVTAFLEQNGYTYPVLMDPTGESLTQWGITAYPTTFLITREGEILGYIPGSVSGSIMQSAIDQALAQ